MIDPDCFRSRFYHSKNKVENFRKAPLVIKKPTTSEEDDPMPSIDDQITEIYVFVDDYLKQRPALARWRESNNNHPAFSDAEALTIGLSQGCFGVQSLKEAYQKIRDNHRQAFPHL